MKSSNFKAQLLQSKQLQNAIGKMVKIGAWEYELNSGDGIWTNELYSIMELPFSAPTPRMDEYITYFPESALPIVRKNWLNLVEKQIPFEPNVAFTYNAGPDGMFHSAPTTEMLIESQVPSHVREVIIIRFRYK